MPAPRFAALVDGTDERFGIDRTHPAYRETGGMKVLLEERAKRRREGNGNGSSEGKKRGEESREPQDGTNAAVDNGDEKTKVEGDGDGGWVENSDGARELSSLVKSLQQKVPSGTGDGKKGEPSKRKKKKRNKSK